MPSDIKRNPYEHAKLSDPPLISAQFQLLSVVIAGTCKHRRFESYLAAKCVERTFGGEEIAMDKRSSHSSADIGCILWIVLVEETSWVLLPSNEV